MHWDAQSGNDTATETLEEHLWASTDGPSDNFNLKAREVSEIRGRTQAEAEPQPRSLRCLLPQPTNRTPHP